jgi:TldD protein
MYQFPKDLYTDIRIETVFSTDITIENSVIIQNKTKTEKGAMIRIFDGNRWYYSATTDVGTLQDQINDLAAMAVPNSQIYNHPVVKILEVNQDICMKYKDIDLSMISQEKKLEVLSSYIPVIKEFDQIKMPKLIYIDNHTVKNIISSKGTNVVFDKQYGSIALRYMLNSSHVPYRCSENIVVEQFDDLYGKQDKFRNTILKDIAYCEEAVPVKPGNYTCILAPIVTGVFAHESFGHKSEADFMIGDETMKKEWIIGRKVGTENLNIIDTGSIEGIGYTPYDDEGCKAKENYLIKNGILTGRLHNSATAVSLGEEQTGNARALNFEFEPIVRMTNTYISPGEKTKEELISSVEEGIYIEDLKHGSGMTTFTITPGKAYMIRGGKLAEPVRISVITGNVMSTLFDIDGISRDFVLQGSALGGCGKMEQWPLPVNFGGPYIRVKNMHIG